MTALKFILNKVVSDPHLHARWINTFSFLEYVGFRKIVKSQEAEGLTLETLTHAIEEGRHAVMLKRLALRFGGQQFDNYNDESMLCGKQAKEYFQTLDHECEKLFIDSQFSVSRMTYLYVTWLVELRALEVYDAYKAALTDHGLEFPLQNLISEEAHHLESVENELKEKDSEFSVRSLELKRIERALYGRYLNALSDVFAVPKIELSNY